MRLPIVVVATIILLMAAAASASLQDKWVVGPIGSIEKADFVNAIYPGHEFYLGYDFVGVMVYTNETARMAVDVVNEDDHFHSVLLIMDCQGRSENEVVSIAPGSAKLVESGLFPYKYAGSESRDYDIFLRLVADWGQPPLRATIRMNNGTGLGNWYTGLYN